MQGTHLQFILQNRVFPHWFWLRAAPASQIAQRGRQVQVQRWVPLLDSEVLACFLLRCVHLPGLPLAKLATTAQPGYPGALRHSGTKATGTSLLTAFLSMRCPPHLQ